jgi:outer membrane protein OmpA-like peptidoglycan-associated protein
VLQRKLMIGASNDPLEVEADRVADQVMAGQEHSAESGSALRIQRFTGQAGGQMDRAPASVERVLASSGRPLEPALRQDMEQRFGHDFSRVRLHTGGVPEQSARDVNALAYTVGHSVVFGAGRFAPETASGRRLIAHELTHVVQQNSGVHAQNIQRACGPSVNRTTEACNLTSTGIADHPRYLFRVNCDDFLEGNELDLRADAASIQSNETVEIHGLASEEGSVNFNLNLSCARALKAKTVIEDVLARRGVSATIITYSHGSQPGGRSVNPSVALIRRTAPRPGTSHPISEPETRQPDQPDAQNNPGKEQRICGPDITSSLTTVLGTVEPWFKGLTIFQQLMSCQAMKPEGILVGVNPFMAWDIEQLYLPNTIWLNDFKLRSCGLPRGPGCDSDPRRHLCETSGTCGNSVVVDGKCLLAGTANYALFGKMCRLCHDYVRRSSRYEMQDLIFKNNLMDPRPPYYVASAAYDGTFPTLPAAAENRGTCTGRCGISHSGVFRFIWEPYKPR